MNITPPSRQFIYRIVALALFAASIFGWITMDEAANILDNVMLLIGSGVALLADRNVSVGPRDADRVPRRRADSAPIEPPAVPLLDVAVPPVSAGNATADRRRSVARATQDRL